jgi:hypothetical protein
VDANLLRILAGRLMFNIIWYLVNQFFGFQSPVCCFHETREWDIPDFFASNQ